MFAAYVGEARRERRTVHALGGRFIVNGITLDRWERMAEKLPPGF